MHSICMHFGVYAFRKERWLVLLWEYTLLAAGYMPTFRFLYLLLSVCLMFTIESFHILGIRHNNHEIHTSDSQTPRPLKDAHISFYAPVRL